MAAALACLALAGGAPGWAVARPVLVDVELNGVVLAEPEVVELEEDGGCRLASAAVRALVDAPGETVRFDDCRHDEAARRVRVTLPATALRRGTLGLAHDTGPAVAPVRTMPALAVDLLATSARHYVAATFGAGDWTYRERRVGGVPAATRRALEYLGPTGMQVIAGDYRAERNVVFGLDDLRGLHFSTRAAALRGNASLAQSLLSVTAPARLVLSSEDGQRVSDLGRVQPGNYLIEGTPASSLPGVLTARLIDAAGRVVETRLPWSADRGLLPEGERLVEGHAGRAPDGGPLQAALSWRKGLSLHETGQFLAERRAGATLLAGELRTRRLGAALLSASAGTHCARDCQPVGFVGLDWSPTMRWSVSASAARWATGVDPSTGRPTEAVRTQWSVSLGGRLVEGVQASLLAQRAGPLRQAMLSVGWRTGPRSQGVLQARVVEGRLVAYIAWSVFLSGPGGTVAATVSSARGTDGRDTPALQLDATPAGTYGWSAGVNLPPGDPARASGQVRFAGPMSDATVSTFAGRTLFAAGTRLWFTPRGAWAAPHGASNLVVADTGVSGVGVQRGGLTVGATDASGLAVVRDAGPHTTLRVSVDPETLPFDVKPGEGARALRTRADRAYWLDLKPDLPRSVAWRLERPLEPGERLWIDGRRVPVSSDAWVGWDGADIGVVEREPREGGRLRCDAMPPAAGDGAGRIRCGQST